MSDFDKKTENIKCSFTL